MAEDTGDSNGTGCPPNLLKIFRLDDVDNKYHCRLCEHVTSRRGILASTSHKSNFIRHVRESHPDLVLSAAQINERFGELLANAVAVHLIPFNAIDSKEWKDVFQFLDNDIQIPSRRAIATKYLPSVISKKLLGIVAAAQGCPVAITTDGWSNGIGGVHLISITIHYINNEWNYIEAVLATNPVRGSQTASVMAEILQAYSFELLNREIESAELQVHTAVTDGASVNPAMCRILGVENVWCTVHIIQLAVRKLDEDATVKALFGKLNALAGNFRRSSPNREKLKEYLTKNGFKKPKVVPRSCPTRWNSDVLQLRRASEYVETLNQMIKDGVKLSISEFTNDEKKLMRTLLIILQYPFSATAELCSSSSVLSDALVVCLRLQERVTHMATKDASSTVRKFCSVFKADLDTRLSNTVYRDWKFSAATVVDPRYFLLEGVYSRKKEDDSKWWEEAETQFITRYGSETDKDDAASIISALSLDHRDDSSDADSTEGRLNLDRSTFTGSLKDDLRVMQSETLPGEEKEKGIEEEFAAYKRVVLNNARFTGPTGHLEFWKKYASAFPILSKIARKLLSIPSSSVLSERTFSRATRLYRDRTRTQMEDQKGEWCVLAGANNGNKIRERNVKRISVKPLHTLGEYSSDDMDEWEEMTQDEDSEEEIELMKSSVKKAQTEAKDRQKDIDAEKEADKETTATSRSKRGRAAVTTSSSRAKRVKN